MLLQKGRRKKIATGAVKTDVASQKNSVSGNGVCYKWGARRRSVGESAGWLAEGGGQRGLAGEAARATQGVRCAGCDAARGRCRRRGGAARPRQGPGR